MPKLQVESATLGAEAGLVRAYLEVMQMRMPGRLRYDIDIADDAAGLSFPPMALLTLIENAIRHGIDPSEAGGRIVVHARRDAGSGRVHVEVADTGVGIGETAVSGNGLANLRDRLYAFFGPEARLDLHEETPHGVRVEILFLPAHGLGA